MSEDKMFPAMQSSTSELIKETWNEAVEKIASMVEEDYDFLGEELLLAHDIRKLKK